MLFSRSSPVGACHPPCEADVGVSYELSEIIVEMIIRDEKCCAGFGFITQVVGVQPACRRNNDTYVMSHSDVTVITCYFELFGFMFREQRVSEFNRSL